MHRLLQLNKLEESNKRAARAAVSSMPKRKEKDESDDEGIVDIDFDFFDPNDNDFLAMKRLLHQLFQHDAELLHTENLVELILRQPLIGTTVKTDGKEADPYAILTVLNMHVHSNTLSIKALSNYCLEKTKDNEPLHSLLQTLFQQESRTADVGFLLSERLVNMPVQIVPHMYRMLGEEIQQAVDEVKPYNFSHYLVISRTYRLTAEDEAAIATAENSRRSKKAKQTSDENKLGSGGVYSFHAEDEVFQKHALFTHDFSFTNQQPRDQDSFGLDVAARIMIIPAEKLPTLIREFATSFPVPNT